MNTVVTILGKKALGNYKDKNKVNPNSDVSPIVMPTDFMIPSLYSCTRAAQQTLHCIPAHCRADHIL